MSYDIYLTDPATSDTIKFAEPRLMVGAIHELGGTTQAWVNVTWNYRPHFLRVLGPNGIREIYGKSGAETLPLLQAAIEQLGTDVPSDYFEPTEGNARRALEQLRDLAVLRPDGVWEGD